MWVLCTDSSLGHLCVGTYVWGAVPYWSTVLKYGPNYWLVCLFNFFCGRVRWSISWEISILWLVCLKISWMWSNGLMLSDEIPTILVPSASKLAGGCIHWESRHIEFCLRFSLQHTLFRWTTISIFLTMQQGGRGLHYDDVIMSSMVSQIPSLTIVYSTFYSGTDQRKHQSSASLAFVRGIHRGPVNSPHKWPVTRKMFPFDDVIMVGGTAITFAFNSRV